MLELTVGATMNRRYIVATTFLGIAACATSGPESPVSGAKVETSVITNNPTAAEGEGEYEVVDVPEVPKMATISDQANVPDQTKVVCRREKATGSHRVMRVCRTRTAIEKSRLADQDALRKLQRKAQ